MEYRDGKPGRGYAKVIDDYSAKSLKNIFDIHIHKQAKITTDGWKGYAPLKKTFAHFEQKLSDKGQNFKMLHIQIRNFKNWLRGVHSYCHESYINQYIQEYFYRFNRLNFRATILEKLLIRMSPHSPITYKSIKCNATQRGNPINQLLLYKIILMGSLSHKPNSYLLTVWLFFWHYV